MHPQAQLEARHVKSHVLCQVGLDSNYQRVALGERSRIVLAPLEQISLELDAQRGVIR